MRISGRHGVASTMTTVPNIKPVRDYMDSENVTKVCFKCKQEKHISDFYDHKKMSDGHLNKCKECTRLDVSKHRINNIEKIREYDRERGSRKERIAIQMIYQREYRRNNREKSIAHQRAERAARSGLITPKPCEVCGAKERIEMHHEDYSKPLDVVFLCSMHHKRAHGMGLGYE